MLKLKITASPEGENVYHLSDERAPTLGDVHTGVGVAGGHEAVLQEQPLVVMGAVADEHLFVRPPA